MTVNEWLQNPQRNVPFTITRKTELTHEGLHLDLEICCLAIIHFAQHWVKELKGKGFNIKEVHSQYESNPTSFTYQDYDFATYWVSKDVIGVGAEVTIL